MAMTDQKNYVSDVHDKVIEIVAESEDCREKLRHMRASRNILSALLNGRNVSSSWLIRFSNTSDLARLLQALRDSGFAFLGQPHGWPPSAIFEDLRSKGL